MHKLDHIVFGAHTLEEGTSFIEKKLQIKLSNIGYHNVMGTYNRVAKLSESIYLEVVAINPLAKSPKIKRWFNLDCNKLQSQLRKSPKIIGYVIENADTKILKHFDPFFKVSRGEYKWKFAMPSYQNNTFINELIETGIMPNLINWESKKPIENMKDCKLDLENLEIILTKKQLLHKNFIDSLGDIEKLKFLILNQNDYSLNSYYPKVKMTIKDKKRNLIISL